MNNLLKLNVLWGIMFAILSVMVFIHYQFDGERNTPLELVDYLQKGGNTFDYYVGYVFFTPLNYKDSLYINMFEFSVVDRIIFHYLNYIFYVAVWIYCFNKILKIETRDIQEDYDFYKKEYQIIFSKQENVSKNGFYTALTVLTALSSYGVYYSIVYCINFLY